MRLLEGVTGLLIGPESALLRRPEAVERSSPAVAAVAFVTGLAFGGEDRVDTGFEEVGWRLGTGGKRSIGSLSDLWICVGLGAR